MHMQQLRLLTKLQAVRPYWQHTEHYCFGLAYGLLTCRLLSAALLLLAS